MSVKQIIVYRRDLNMRKGKIAAQVAHASMKVFLDRKIQTLGGYRPGAYLERADGRPEFPEDTTDLLMVPLTSDMLEWVTGIFTKVVLTVETEADLLRVHELAKQAKIPTALITDAGATEFHGVLTNTAVAVGPFEASEIDKITGPEGAVPTKLP